MAVDVLQTLKTIISDKKLRVTINDAALNKPFKELGLDSLDVFDVIVALEDKVGVKLPDAVMMNLKTINDLVDAINQLLAEK